MEIHLSGMCDVKRAENDGKRSVKPHAVRRRQIGLTLSVPSDTVWDVSQPLILAGRTASKSTAKWRTCKAIVACLAATLKEQAAQTQKRSAQLAVVSPSRGGLGAIKPAPRVANNPWSRVRPNKAEPVHNQPSRFTACRPFCLP